MAPDFGRRRFVAALAGTTLAVTTAGCNFVSGQSSEESTVSMTVGPDTAGLSGEERASYVERMTEKYGSEAVDGIEPADDKTVPVPRMEVGRLVWADEQSLSITDGGTTLVESDNYAAVYGAADSQYYLHWLWSAAQTSADGSGALTGMWSHVDLTNESELTVYEPSSEREDNGTVGPHPELTGQDTDEFAVRWEGDHEGVRTVTGNCVERRDGPDRGFEWTVHLAGKR